MNALKVIDDVVTLTELTLLVSVLIARLSHFLKWQLSVTLI